MMNLKTNKQKTKTKTQTAHSSIFMLLNVQVLIIKINLEDTLWNVGLLYKQIQHLLKRRNKVIFNNFE